MDFIPARALFHCAENHRGLCLLWAALSLKGRCSGNSNSLTTVVLLSQPLSVGTQAFSMWPMIGQHRRLQ